MREVENSKLALRILGIDPGTATTGWAIVEEKNGKITTLSYGCLNTDKNSSDEARILEISQDLQTIIDKYQPHEACVEELFFFKNKKTVIQVAQSRGAILLTLGLKNVKVSGYTPLEIKQALTGYGRADKKQMQEMVKNIMKLDEIPKPDDAADAIAIALCRAHSRKINNLI